MIITDTFVMINFPKTGSSFARKMLQKAHQFENYSFIDRMSFKLKFKKRPLFIVHQTPNIRDMSHKYNFMDEHGIYIQIPDEHKHKKVISIKRNVYARYVSLYEFQDWKRAPWIDKGRLYEKFSNYPDITFEEFMFLLFSENPFERLPQINNSLELIGPATAQFILFFFKDPFNILNTIDEHYIDSDNYKNDIAPVFFLDQANLNKELYNFLRQQGYPDRKVKFILEAKKINNSTPKHKTIDDYFSAELYNMVNQKEKLLFKILKDQSFLGK